MSYKEAFDGELHWFDCPNCGGKIKLPLMIGDRGNSMPVPIIHHRKGRRPCRLVNVPGPPHRMVVVPPSQSYEDYMQRFMA